MKSLSTLKFLKGSLGKVLPLAITVSLSVMLLSFFLMVADQLINNDQTLDVNPFLNMSIITGTDEVIDDQQKLLDFDTVQKSRWIDLYSFADIQRIDYKAPSKIHTMLLIMLPSTNLEAVMRWQKLTLTEGTLPRSSGEIMLHQKLADTYHLRVGDTVPRDLEGWYINKGLKIAGITEGRAVINLGIEAEDELMTGNLSLITLAEDDQVAAMNQHLEDNFGTRYELMTLQRGQETLDESKKSILLVMTFIGVLIVVALSVLLGNIGMIQYSQRIKEFELLFAVGYTKKQIAGKVLREIGSSNLLGYCIGLGFGFVIGWITNICLFTDPKDYMNLWNIQNMLWTSLIPVLVTFTSFLAPMKLLHAGIR